MVSSGIPRRALLVPSWVGFRPIQTVMVAAVLSHRVGSASRQTRDAVRAGGVLIDALRAAVPPGQFVAREEERFIMARVTRAGLTNAVLDEAELPDRDARSLVDTVIDMVAERLTAGETVMISGFRHLHRARQGREDGP